MAAECGRSHHDEHIALDHFSREPQHIRCDLVPRAGELGRQRLDRMEKSLAGCGHIINDNDPVLGRQFRPLNHAALAVAFGFLADDEGLDRPLLKKTDRADGTHYELMSSAMKLQMRLLHEEDLLNFLADLRDSVSAYLRIRRCDLDRLPRSGNMPVTSAELKAECLIDWLTLREQQ